jgi:hypothetical protein
MLIVDWVLNVDSCS